MLDLAQVFQFVEHSFNEGSAPQKCLIKGRVLNRRHVLAHFGDELHLLLAKSFDQPLGDIAFICIDKATPKARETPYVCHSQSDAITCQTEPSLNLSERT